MTRTKDNKLSIIACRNERKSIYLYQSCDERWACPCHMHCPQSNGENGENLFENYLKCNITPKSLAALYNDGETVKHHRKNQKEAS